MKIKKKRKELKKEFSIQNFLMKCKENFIMIVLQLPLPAVLIEYALCHRWVPGEEPKLNQPSVTCSDWT